VRPRLFYGWIIVAVAFVAYTISIGPRQTFSIFLLAFLEEFGGSRSRIAGIFSFHIIAYGLGGWGLGTLVDRFGPRRIIVGSTAVWVVTLLACSQTTHLWQMYLLYGLVGGFAAGGFSYVANNALVARWFRRSRGFAIGWVQAASSRPAWHRLFAPVMQWCIAHLGWRSAYVLGSTLAATSSLPLAIHFLRDDPRDMGLEPDGGLEPGRVDHPAIRREAAGSGTIKSYWLLFGANILRGMSMYALVVHEAAYLVDTGFSKPAAAAAFLCTFLLAVLGGLLAGTISDRAGRTPTYAGIAALYAVGYVALLASGSATSA
jgi:sugar phosphate permease